MKEAYLSLRRLIQLSNQVLDFPYTNRTPEDISACENALFCLCAELASYRANYSGMEFELGKAAIRALESATFAARLISHGPHLHQILENWREGMFLSERLLYATSGKRNIFATTRRVVHAIRSPNPKFLEHLDDAYQAWLSRQVAEQKRTSPAPIEAPAAPTRSETVKAKVKRDKLQESRDKWIYTQAKKGDKTYRKIMLELAKLALEKGWRKLGSPQAVEQAVDRYVVRHNLTPLPPRMER